MNEAAQAFLEILAEAKAEPSTSTKAICMENFSRFHRPSFSPPSPPQAQIIRIGPIPVPIIAAINTTMVRMMANRNGSGS